MEVEKRLSKRVRRGWDYGVAACFLLLLSLIVAKLEKGNADMFSDCARVMDGDTLVLNDRHVRLFDIDAPELAQTSKGLDAAVQAGGRDARAALRALAGTAKMNCEGQCLDKYRRTLTTCFVESRKLNQAMVEQGLAIAYGRYDTEEKRSRMQSLGIWATEFERLKQWRKSHDRSHSADPSGAWRS